MEKAFQYIKRLLVFFLCLFLFYISFEFVPFYITIPLLLLAFSILHARITDEKPPHLFAFYRTDSYFKKGGLRDLLRIVVTLFGFLYDTIIWTVWGIYLIFILFVDLLDLIKTVLYWILHAILWILRQYVPFLILLYRLFIHYLIRWPWWLYQIAYYNIRYAFNKNCYFVALWGTMQASFIIFLFFYLEFILLDIPNISYIGIIIALLPLTWSYGEIASIRVQNLEKEPYRAVRMKFQNGIESVRSILFYITIFVVLLLTQFGLNLLGWIPESGIVIAGFVFNINTFINLLLLFISILIVMGVLIIPSYRLFNSFSEIKFTHTLELLKVIWKKWLQYLVVSIPSGILSFLVIALPFAVMIMVGIFTYSVKNVFTEIRINHLQTEQASTASSDSAYLTGKKIEQLQYLKQFPLHFQQEIEHRPSLSRELSIDIADLKSMNEEFLKDTEESKKKMEELQQQIDQYKSTNPADIALNSMIEEMIQLQNNFATLQQTRKSNISRLKTDIYFLDQRLKQIPWLAFFAGLWLVLFGSIVVAFYISYLGNVFHRVYIFRNTEEPSEWHNAIAEIRAKNHHQPLLGGTLFVISVFLIYLLITNVNITKAVIIFINSFLTF